MSGRQQRQLGRGGYSVVYRPSSLPQGQRSYVIKRPLDARNSAKYQHQKDVVDRLRQENPLLSERFVKIYQVSQKGQSLMEDLGDKTLENAIRQNWYRLKSFQDDFDSVVKQLIQTVVVMLGSGVAHRDIKPGNIMVLYDGDHYHLTFVDFTDAQTKEKVDVSQRYSNFGSPLFMSPEALQRRMGRVHKKGPWDEYVANDLWSLGIVLYMLLFGEHPFSKLRKTYPRFRIPDTKQVRSVISAFASFYQDLEKNYKTLYPVLFPLLGLPLKKRKYIPDVVALLSFDPKIRLQWLRGKTKKLHAQTEQRTHAALSRLLSAASQLQRPSKRAKTSNS